MRAAPFLVLIAGGCSLVVSTSGLTGGDAGVTDGDAGVSDGGDSGDASDGAAPPDAGADNASCGGADLATDPANCGACGHDCAGGACTSGACQPVLLVTASASSLAVDDKYVYWSTYSEVWRALKTDGGDRIKVAGGLAGSTTSLSVDDSAIYWADYVANGDISKLDKVTLGAPTRLTLATNPSGLIIGPASAYFIVPGYIDRSSLDGGPPQTVTTASASYLAIDATNVYWTERYNDYVGKGPLAGGAPLSLVTGARAPRGIALDTDNVYFTEEGSNPPTVFDGRVRRVAKDGAPASLVTLATGQAIPTALAIDATALYWLNHGNAGSDAALAGGAVMKLPLNGGTPTQLAGAGDPVALALDGVSVFWADQTDGTIRRVVK